jgi:uncharacterized Tic20 family protein
MSFGVDEEEERHWEREAGIHRVGAGEDGRVSGKERNWAVAAELAGFAKYLIPFGNIALTFFVWLMKRDESSFVELHAREAMNFQISMTLYLILGWVLSWILIGYLLVALLMAFDLIAVIMGALRASRGELYRYPASIRLISPR